MEQNSRGTWVLVAVIMVGLFVGYLNASDEASQKQEKIYELQDQVSSLTFKIDDYDKRADETNQTISNAQMCGGCDYDELVDAISSLKEFETP